MKAFWVFVIVAALSVLVLVTWTGSSPRTEGIVPARPDNPRDREDKPGVRELVAERAKAKESTTPDRPKSRSQRKPETVDVLQMDLAVLNSHLKLRLPAELLDKEKFRTDVNALRQFRLEEYRALWTTFNTQCADRAYRIHKSRMGSDRRNFPTKPDPSKGPVLAKSTAVGGTVFLYAQYHADLQSLKINIDDLVNKFRHDIEDLSRQSR